jgi:hypothetical protein
MIKDITLGQFFPGDSTVHRLDPRTKLVLTLVYIVALFTAGGYYSYGLMFAVLVTCILLSRINLKTILRSVRPLIYIIIFTFILNILFTKGDPIVEFWIIQISREGLKLGATMIVRLVMLIVGTFLLTYTTSPIALTDGLENLMNPLKKIRVPVHELAMMMSIALRSSRRSSRRPTRSSARRRHAGQTSSPATSSGGPGRCCRSLCRFSSARSVEQTSWPWPWKAAAITAEKAAPASNS